MHISIVIPVYGCDECLNELYFRLKSVIVQFTQDFEVIMVNDASPDNAWETIKILAKKDKRVKGINFSRNFGQHYAITAGLNYAKGEWIIVMDCDLQDQPEEIVKLYNKGQEGYDIVFARRAIRKDKYLKKLLSKLFYKFFDYFTNTKSDEAVATFGIYSKQVIINYRKLGERNRLFPISVRWLGFNIGYIDVKHTIRNSGKSSYTFSKLLNIAIDNIIAQSNKPLKLSIKFGFTLSLLSFLYGIYLILRKFFLDVSIGWTSIIVSIFFIGGLIFANFGLIGLYIGKIFEETQKRPLYIIKEMVGLD